ncbi:DUF952 domain-containing protein [Brevundimonas vitis]|uniref:DUF952 domain-containing protein n=1 Tax=Brevundimonas vitisensis TaxID=2800818 RepID=A0ABX7BIX8_9CAUL|nr:DUF952 domain-containing protein [Brevundimonas vitisensis]QQQ17502.1 DUF952 domain-containing protein [Brevundimonas vitisensis]
MNAQPWVAFKIVDRAEWEAALPTGLYAGSAVDLADGYIHLSTAEQVVETLRRHYAGRSDLLALTVDLTRLDEPPVWEESRGGALFPHLYAPLPASAVTAAQALSVSADGTPVVEGTAPWA